jgi:predicted transposase/invertase (TIGR01784 family)
MITFSTRCLVTKKIAPTRSVDPESQRSYGAVKFHRVQNGRTPLGGRARRGEKGCEVQLLGFLNAVLGRTGDNRFTSVEIHEDKTFTPEMIGDKSVTFDVRATLQDKTRVNVEAQIRDRYNMDKRSLFYWGREFVKTIKSGDDYQKIPDVISVNIVGYNFPHAKNFHTCFHLREDREPHIKLTNSLEIHYLNMVQYYRTLGSRLRKGKLLLSDPLCEDPLIPWLAARCPS